MKKLLLLPAVLMGIAASAQYTQSLYRYGVTANIHQSNIKNIHWYSKGRIAPSIGIFGVIPFTGDQGTADVGRPGGFYFVPQLEFTWDGENNDPSTGKQTYRTNFISLPLNVRYYFAVSKNAENKDFYVQAGPQIGFSVYDKASGPSDALSEDNKERVNYIVHHENEYKKFNLGLTVGAGYRFTDNWDVFVRYDHGLSKAYGFNPSEGDRKTYHYKLGAGVNYTFGNNTPAR